MCVRSTLALHIGGAADCFAWRLRALQRRAVRWVHAQVLGGCGGLFYAWWMFWASDSIKATLEETTAPVVGLLLSAASWVKDCVQALAARVTGAPPCSQAGLCTFMLTTAGSCDMLRLLARSRICYVEICYEPIDNSPMVLSIRHAGRQRRADAAEAFFQPLASGEFGLDGNEEELGHAPPVLR